MKYYIGKLLYHFMITENGEQIYSNLSQQDIETGQEIAGEAMEHAKILTTTKYDVY